MPKLENKTEYEVSEATETYSSYFEKSTEHIQYNESFPTIKDANMLI